MQDAAHAFEEDDSGLRDEENNKRLKVATEREKEKTKMRERHRRSITTKILAGLRKHGNYDLPARADINDVLRALAMEAGWVVEADGTTYRNPALPQTFSCPDHPRLPDCMRMNRSSSNPGSSTLVSLTPVPSGSSLNSLKGFDCALPPFDIEAIDTAGGDCSATSSPGPISSAHVNLMQSDITHFLTAADEDTPLAHFTNPLSLGGFAGHYLLGNEVDLFNLQDDTTIAGAVAYHMTHAEEAKVLAARQSPPKTPAPRPSSFPMTSASLNHPHYGYHAINMGPYEYSCTTSLPSILSCTHPHPFLQESRASNQNTPIGSPQPHGGGF